MSLWKELQLHSPVGSISVMHISVLFQGISGTPGLQGPPGPPGDPGVRVSKRLTSFHSWFQMFQRNSVAPHQ